MTKRSGFLETLKNFKISIKKDKKLLLIVACGIIGMLLLLVTEVCDNDKSSKKTDTKSKNNISQCEYEENYKVEVQDQLETIISSIDGAGETKVMVTLESGSKSVYAVDEKIDDNNDSSKSDDDYKRDSNYKRETEHILVNSKNKEDGGLIIEVLQPKVRGVAVVCEGADKATVREDITDTVTAVLDIDTNRVSIQKMIND